MAFLGDVETGWFANLARGCRAAGQGTLNVVSCGHKWGDRLYSQLDADANEHVSRVNDAAISHALANGASRHQAFAAGSAAMETIAVPTDAKESLKLASRGDEIVSKTLKYEPIKDLGNVEHGWFAKLAHGGRRANQATLNAISGADRWGDRLYSAMDNAANKYVNAVNEDAIAIALANGATHNQALAAGSAAMERIAQPRTPTDILAVPLHGSRVIRELIKDEPTDGLGSLQPLLVAAAALAGIYIVADSL